MIYSNISSLTSGKQAKITFQAYAVECSANTAVKIPLDDFNNTPACIPIIVGSSKVTSDQVTIRWDRAWCVVSNTTQKISLRLYKIE